jgi:hypothetical protein
MRIMLYAIAYCDDLCYLELPLDPALQVEPFAFAHSHIDDKDAKWKGGQPGLGAD